MIETYEDWIGSLGLPIHRGFFVEDLRTVETGWWEERGCEVAFIRLTGQEDLLETKVIKIPPGKTTQPWKFALDDVFYVLEGKGLTAVWGMEQTARKTFEWGVRSLFLIPRQSYYQLSNAQGDKPAVLLSHNYFPLATQVVADPEFYLNNSYLPEEANVLEEFYSEAKAIKREADWGSDTGGITWSGNFFPDLGIWDRLDRFERRGAGGHQVRIKYPIATRGGGNSMSVFPAGRYKKAHYHEAGNFIVIPAGEGFSLIWDDDKERIFIPWHEGSCFAPQFYHQHFNLGTIPARYLKFGYGWGGMRRHAQRYFHTRQIEYPDEDPWIRETFEKELSKRGLKSLMPNEVYKKYDYDWEYAKDSDAD
ncbi:MAG: hypothetical protein Q8O55_06285 [Dehalococcoidales bacterium]|nr:hypothetical protein [Dehalococcoidales bacterium]